MMRPDDNQLREGSVLLRSGTLTPPSLPLNLRAYCSNWRLIGNLDGHGLDQDLRRAGWNLFFIAEAIQGYAIGSGGESSVKRAVATVLAKVKARGFNCAQISDIVVKRCLGFPYVRVEANPRHLQQSNTLESFEQRTLISAAATWAIG
jgi:hypothetical protein